MASISLKNIYKIYPPDVTAVSDFSMEIWDKEFIVLVGPSGCGKSTTLRMIAGLEEISKGELCIDGRIVNDVPPKDRNIAMVFQNYALYPHMTVYKNIAFGLELRKMPREEIKQRVQDAAKILDIEHLLDRRPKALSGGQRQRVALGRAMVRNPAVFLLDEPLSNLDAKLRTSMRTELIKLHQSLGTTFVYVTHDQTEAMTMGDRIVIMKDGFIQQIDTPQKLYDEPYNIFVAGFIGTPQMNFIRGILRKNNDDWSIATNYKEIVIDRAKITAQMSDYIDKEVIMGIRSEDIHDEEEFLANNADNVLLVNVEVREQMGSEVYLHLTCQGEQLVARVRPNTASMTGQTISISIDKSKVHIFDPETEIAIMN
jgi:multiple sugar transport system ATP-binding protein